MNEETKALLTDATRYLVVAMDPDKFTVLHIEESEGSAQEKAKNEAMKEEGRIIGVFQKVGTAEQVRKVEWRGATR